jgi:hypothetical protein
MYALLLQDAAKAFLAEPVLQGTVPCQFVSVFTKPGSFIFTAIITAMIRRVFEIDRFVHISSPKIVSQGPAMSINTISIKSPNRMKISFLYHMDLGLSNAV